MQTKPWQMEYLPYYVIAKNKLDEQGIFQWTNNYPTLAIVENDIDEGNLYCAILENQCVGIINISEEQEPEYDRIAWKNNNGKILVIHRLAVDPLFQGKGIAKKLMDFAEQFGIRNNYPSVRLDAFSENKRVLEFYETRGYKKRGEVYFAGRQSPFFCYEMDL